MLMTRSLLGIVVVLVLSGCQSYWNADSDFGSSVNGAVRAQAINPDPPTGNPYAKAHMDGISAKATVDNYQKSFTAPARPGQGNTGSLISINSGSGLTTSGVGGTP